MSLPRVLKKWQTRLGLAGWEISLQRKPIGADQPRWGESRTNILTRTASITLAPKREWRANAQLSVDIPTEEEVIVHELLHVKLHDEGMAAQEENMSVNEERLINSLARAFLNTEKEGKK